MIQILLLRLRLLWHFKPWWYPCPYRVDVRKQKGIGPYKPFWAYVNLLAAGERRVHGSFGPASHIDVLPAAKQLIGALDQFELDEALEIAARQCECRINPPPPPPERPPAPESAIPPGCSITYAMCPDSNYKIVCSCGKFIGRETEPKHMCLPQNCPSCADVHREWEQHVAEAMIAAASPEAASPDMEPVSLSAASARLLNSILTGRAE